MKKLVFGITICLFSVFLCCCKPNKSETDELEVKSYCTSEADDYNSQKDKKIIEAIYIGITIDKKFTHENFSIQDFSMLDIKELIWVSEYQYKNYLKEGTIPKTFRQKYRIRLNTIDPEEYIEAVHSLENEKLDFIKTAEIEVLALSNVSMGTLINKHGFNYNGWTKDKLSSTAFIKDIFLEVIIKQEFTERKITSEDFPLISIEKLEWESEAKYNEFIRKGIVPNYFRQEYRIRLNVNKNEEYIDAMQQLQNLNSDFIQAVDLIVKSPGYIEIPVQMGGTLFLLKDNLKDEVVMLSDSGIKHYVYGGWTKEKLKQSREDINDIYLTILVESHFMNRVLQIEDFSMSNIKELIWVSETEYKKYLTSGDLPKDFKQEYQIRLTGNENEEYIDTLQNLQNLDLDFIMAVFLKVKAN